MVGDCNRQLYFQIGRVGKCKRFFAGCFRRIDQVGNKVKGLTAKQGEKQVEEDAAKTAYEEAYEAKALIEQSIKDLPADEDLQKQLAEAAEALGKAKEKKDAWQNSKPI